MQTGEKIVPFTDEYSDFFRHKLVPDEHFFQTLIAEKLTNQIRLSNDNRRQIIFDKNVNNGNSPIYLPGFLLSLALIGFFLYLGISRFRKMEKTFADII